MYLYIQASFPFSDVSTKLKRLVRGDVELEEKSESKKKKKNIIHFEYFEAD